jgi:hypothetical protein
MQWHRDQQLHLRTVRGIDCIAEQFRQQASGRELAVKLEGLVQSLDLAFVEAGCGYLVVGTPVSLAFAAASARW